LYTTELDESYWSWLWIRLKRAEIYSIALRNSNPNKRMSPILSWRKTRATIGGVSLGTIPEEAGEGAGIVK
jgi:hypothetical protein